MRRAGTQWGMTETQDAGEMVMGFTEDAQQGQWGNEFSM